MASKTYTTDQIDALLPQGVNTGDQTLALLGSTLTISGENGNSVTIPTGNGGGTTNPVVDASTTIKGIVQLAGDLGGTADTPTVPALQAKAPNLTVLAVSTAASAVLVGDTVNPVDATSGAATRNLPAPTRAGQVIEIEKVDSTTNTVAVSGTIRGNASTINLVWQYETVALIAENLSSWRPLYSHKTKTALDAAYANVLGTPSNPVTSASAARPGGLAVVYWLCATQPTNWLPNDVWINNS